MKCWRSIIEASAERWRGSRILQTSRRNNWELMTAFAAAFAIYRHQLHAPALIAKTQLWHCFPTAQIADGLEHMKPGAISFRAQRRIFSQAMRSISTCLRARLF